MNGNKIGTGTNYLQAQRYCVPLVLDCNVFAIEGLNTLPGSNAAGALAAIQIRYMDVFVEKIITDSDWHGVAGFEQVDDSDWAAAVEQGAWPTWTGHTAIAIPSSNSDLGQNLRDASWIWTNKEKNAIAPVGARAFSRTVTLPVGQLADTISTIDIIVDDEYTIYVNGLLVGSGTQYNVAEAPGELQPEQHCNNRRVRGEHRWCGGSAGVRGYHRVCLWMWCECRRKHGQQLDVQHHCSDWVH